MTIDETKVQEAVAGAVGKNAVSFVNHMAGGVIANNKKPLFPISQHQSGRLLDPKKLATYAVDEDNMQYETAARSHTVSGDSFKSVAQDFGSTFEASGSYGFSCGASVSVAAAGEFSTSQENSEQCSFAQVRKEAVVATLQLPNQLKRDQLRALADNSALELIDAVANETDADEFVNNFGPVIIHRASWGGLLTISSNTNQSSASSTQELSARVEAEAEYLAASGGASSSARSGTSTSQTDSNTKVTINAIGGEPAKILNGDEAGWFESMANNLVLVDIKLAPVSILAQRGSKQESLLDEAAKKFTEARAKFNDAVVRERTMDDHSKKEAIRWELKCHAEWHEGQAAEAQGWVDAWSAVADKTRNNNWKCAAVEGAERARELLGRIDNDHISEQEFKDRIEWSRAHHLESSRMNWGMNGRDSEKSNEMHVSHKELFERVNGMLY